MMQDWSYLSDCDCSYCEEYRREMSPDDESYGTEPYGAVLRQMTNLHNTRQVGYGTNADPYANVRASEEWAIDGKQVPAWVGAMMRACDKIKRLKSFAATGKLDDEKVEDCFLDCANYVAIGLVLYREKAK